MQEVEQELADVVIDLLPLYDKANEWNADVVWKLFEVLLHTLFPNHDVDVFVYPTDVPSIEVADRYDRELKKFVEKCKLVVELKEYDSVYYCIY
ncbi:MAG: hypothetical protein QXR23_08905 [Ignisphaera sp.]